MDITEFLVTLGQDPAAKAEYDADPAAYVNRSALSDENKRRLLARPPTAEDINQAIARSAADRSGATAVARDAGNVKASTPLGQRPADGPERT